MDLTAMRVTLEIPEDLAPIFGAGAADLTKTALESLALEGLRSGRLSDSQARRILGISSRYEMDGFLKAHDIMLDLSVEDVMRDAETARSFRAK